MLSIPSRTIRESPARPLLVILIILICVPVLLLGQERPLNSGDKTFLPEAYVKSILSTHRLKETQMFREQPIEAILINNRKKYLRTYGGKETLASIKKNSLGKWELLHVNKLLNLNYFREDDFKNTKFFINQANKNLSLYIVDSTGRKTIPFISSFNGYQFEHPRSSYIKLLLNGSYELLDSGKKTNIIFNLDGTISNNEHWGKYVVDRVYMFTDHQDDNFHSITLISKKGDSHLNLAFAYHKDTKSWEGFSFKTVKGNIIVLTKDRTIKLIRK